ncbi:hypothetical protein D3C75_1248520 [compost metagenome]
MSAALIGEPSSSLPTWAFMAGFGPRKESSRLVWKNDGHTTCTATSSWRSSTSRLSDNASTPALATL